jgi:hypothetical protein
MTAMTTSSSISVKARAPAPPWKTGASDLLAVWPRININRSICVIAELAGLLFVPVTAYVGNFKPKKPRATYQSVKAYFWEG